VYGQWFRKNVEINAVIPSISDRTEARTRAKEFLVRQGFRDVSETDDRIRASRGSRLLNLLSVDPRRHAHTIELVEDQKVLRARIVVDNWATFGTNYDTAVFDAELTVLDLFVGTGHFDDSRLRQAQRRRGASDFVRLARAVILGIAIFAIAGIVTFGTFMLHGLSRPWEYAPPPSNRANEVSAALHSAVEAGDAGIVDLGHVANFDWDKMYIYGSYTPYPFIRTRHRHPLPDYKGYVKDAHCLLVFTSGSQVVEIVLHRNRRGNFSDVLDRTGRVTRAVYTREDAIFKVDTRGQYDYPYLIEAATSDE